MYKTMDKKTMWALAAKNGLILSLITIVIELLKSTLHLTGTIATVLTIVKLVAISWLLYYYMKEYSKDKEYVTYGQSFNYGFIICFCSSIVCSVFAVLLYTVITPETMELSITTIMEAFEKSGAAFNMEYDDIYKVLPFALTIGMFINCIIFGLIIPSIIANWTKKGDIFTRQNSETIENN